MKRRYFPLDSCDARLSILSTDGLCCALSAPRVSWVQLWIHSVLSEASSSFGSKEFLRSLERAREDEYVRTLIEPSNSATIALFLSFLYFFRAAIKTQF